MIFNKEFYSNEPEVSQLAHFWLTSGSLLAQFRLFSCSSALPRFFLESRIIFQRIRTNHATVQEYMLKKNRRFKNNNDPDTVILVSVWEPFLIFSKFEMTQRHHIWPTYVRVNCEAILSQPWAKHEWLKSKFDKKKQISRKPFELGVMIQHHNNDFVNHQSFKTN